LERLKLPIDKKGGLAMIVDGLQPRLLAAVLLASVFVLCDVSFAQTPFYQGKTITIVHGRAPGGSGDLRVRAVIPFLQKYIPGNPTFVHEYMDGGGGRKAANYIFAAARPDGLSIGNVGGGVVANAILGEQGVQYDLDKLHFIGSPYSGTHYMFVTRREVGLKNLEKLRAYTGLRIGAQSVGHTNYTLGRIFASILGLKETKYVTGYSIPERDVALMRGEIDAITNSDDFYARNPEWIDKGLVDFHVVMEIPKGEKHPQFSKLPEIDTFAKTERARKVLSMFRLFRLSGSPFILPPAIPKDRAEIIKEGLRKAFKDPEFVKEYRKVVGEDPTPLLPEENERAIRELPRDPETVEVFKKFAGAGALPTL
jgi:tripartite-type tricarboxylate transporter receptor subunit TctC